jgi:hypothetical protein
MPRVFHFSILALTIVLASSPASASEPVTGEVKTVDGPKAVPHAFNGDVRDLPQIAARSLLFSREHEAPADLKPYTREREIAEPNLALAPMPAPSQSFNGLSFNTAVTGGQAGGGWPPDVNGDVGPSHYIESVNSAYAIYNKTGTLLAAFTENSLWSGAGTSPCNGHSVGDPVVIHDALADRWILTHFAFSYSNGQPVSPFYECLAVSKTSDPVAGGWWLYALRMDPGGTGFPPVGTLNDYPKFGIWTDCLYMATNEFTEPAGGFVGTTFASLSRSDMYAGAALTWGLGFINNSSDPDTMIPSNLLGTGAGSLPPAGTPNYFVSESNTAFAFEVRKFTAGANCGGGGSLSAATNVSQTSYSFPGTAPQPNTATRLDSIDDRLMQKVQYRRIGSAESLWVTHSVQSGSILRPQWAQLSVTGGTIATTPVQQQIYAPDSTLHRWMPSLAVDGQGNMAIGYSTSNGSSPNFPSIAYSGRLASDPLNNLSQTETQLVAGAGSQTGVQRWGDYTAMSIDPADDCTFWYINEYYSSQTNGTNGNWQTRIGSFKFPGCGQAQTPPSVTTNAATSIGQTSATLNASVNPNGSSTTVFYDYGLTTSYGTSVTYGSIGSGTSSVSTPFGLTGLTCNTLYHFRARASNGGGTTNGGDLSFTTSACSITSPSVTTNAATSIGQTSATLNASVNPNASSTTVFYDYGLTASYGSSVTYGGIGSGTSSVSTPFALTGLSCNTGYHFRARASNGGGTTNGGDLSFTTSTCSSPIGSFFTLTPCRLIDTRGGGPLEGGSIYEISVTGFCGVPSTATAVSANVTVVGATAGGYVVFWPAQGSFPPTSTISFSAGQVRANNAVLGLAPGYFGAAGAVWVYADLGDFDSVHVIIDVSGYFQ